MKKYTTSSSYGDARRIWMVFDVAVDEGVAEKLKGLSIWKGIDKDDGTIVSWEFHPDQFEEAQNYLTENGFGWVSTISAL